MAATLLASIFLLLVLAGHSAVDAAGFYCICKDGVGDYALERTLEYACAADSGAKANCSAIRPNGTCYHPNTVQSHCSFAVNSIFQATGHCGFGGVAILTTNDTIASLSSAGCVYQSTPDGYGGLAMAPVGFHERWPEFIPGMQPAETGASLAVSAYQNLKSTLLWVLFMLELDHTSHGAVDDHNDQDINGGLAHR